MRINRQTVLLACVALFSMIGCTVFSVGPYVMELRYEPSATTTPLPSATPNTPVATAPPTISGDWAVTGLTVLMPNGQLACDTSSAISFNVTNAGSGPTPVIEARVLQIGPSRMQLFSEAFAPVPALEPGASHFVEVSLPLHTTPNNRYMIRALVDFPNSINEPNEPNNEQNTSVEVTCGASPNLRVSGLGIDGVNCVSETEIRFTVINDGSATAPYSMTYVDVVNTEVINVPTVPELTAGASTTISILLPLHTLPDGTYILRARVDPTFTIFELNEHDNSAEISIAVACGAGPTLAPTSGIRPTAEVFPTATINANAADLVVTALTAIGTGVNPRCGENTRVDFTVENRGVGAATASTIHIADYNESVITTEAWYGIPPLQLGERYSGSVNIVVGRPPNIVHTLHAQVDPDFTVVESDETNNAMSISYNVDDAGGCPPLTTAAPSPTGPDAGANISLEALTIKGSGVNPRCGDASRIDFTVRNTGTTDVPATRIEFYDYTEASFDMTASAQAMVPALGAGLSFAGSATITIGPPPNMVHRLTAHLDAGNDVQEANESDNSLTLRYNVDEAGGCP